MRTRSSHGKAFKKKIVFLTIAAWGCQLLASGPALAAPQGGVVTSGSAAISQSGSATNINQSTNKASINWQSFGTTPAETVNFNQPNASSITLNRVIGNERSVLEGALNANGRVFLINSNGILFTKGSSVNTAGFVGSTLNLTDEDFNAGNYVFKANGAGGSVINMGTITAKEGGYVALLGNSVSNQGIISATKGTVALASGDRVTLNFNGDSLVSVTVDEGTLNALVENKEAIYADGGKVILTAGAADDLLGAQVNNTGLIQARTVDDLKGDIRLHAYGGTTNVDGTLDASAPNSGDGGFIETSGDKVKVADTAAVTTRSAYGTNGTWLIDPDGYTIGVGGDMTGAALTAALTGGNVSISSTRGSGSDGNIDVNDPVSWSANTLTLNATSNIFVNNVMTATGTAGFAANYGTGTNADMTPMGLYTYQGTAGSSIPFFAGRVDFSGSGKVFLNGAEYTVIKDLAGLNAARSNPAGNYALGSNWGISSWSAPLDNGTAFTGNFNGLGHSFTSFFPSAATSLFGTIGEGAVVSNLSIGQAGISASAAATKTSAGILADVNRGSIVNSMAAGYLTITDNSNKTTNIVSAGGLVGTNSGLIAQSFSYLAGGPYGINGVTNIAGGLVGTNTSTGVIVDSSVRYGSGITGATYPGTQIAYVGGLVGVNEGKIYRSYVRDMPIKLTYADDTTSIAGGFAGKNTGIIDESYATLSTGGSHFQAPRLGGFVGENTGTITNAYTTLLYMNDLPNASTQGLADWTAGFAYKNSGTIKNAYATAYSTNSKQRRYGFVYDNTGGTIANAYWYAKTKDGASVPADTAEGVTELTADQAAVFSSYAGFDASIWGASASGYPILRNIPVYIIANTDTGVPIYGLATSDASTLNLKSVGLQGGGGMATLADSITSTTDNPFIAKTANGYVDAGIRNAADVLSSPIYSNIKGTVTVDPKELVIIGVVADKTYDGTTNATLNKNVAKNGLAGLLDSQTLNITYTSAQFTDKNAGVAKDAVVTYTGLSDGANGGKTSNYTIVSNHTTAKIAQKQISAGAARVEDKVYDGTIDATMSSYQLTGKIAGDNLSLAGAAAFADKNAGQGKAVTVSGISLTGADAGNYKLQNTSLTTTGTIKARPLNLLGAKQADGSAGMPASSLAVMNAVGGDSIGLGGTATLSSADTGVQSITNLNKLTVNNPNYTVVGSVGSVVVGKNNLVLDGATPDGVTIDRSVPNKTTITTPTDKTKTVLDWLRFNIAAGETVRFDQSAATSIVLNRVTGNEASVIAGTLSSNGRVFIINSNGILFAAGSSVNTAGLIASVLAISNDNFMNGNYVFTAANSGSIVSKGDIIIADGGFVALAANDAVTHSGNITAPGGKALLVAADTLTLTLNTADAGLDTYKIENLKGTTSLYAYQDNGTRLVNGNVNVSGAAGGLVETAGRAVFIPADSDYWPKTGTDGTWSLSLPSLTIGTNGAFSGGFVNTNLGLRNLSLNALNGDVTINAPITWSTDSTLGLSAKNNIYINKSITAEGENGGLVMNYGGDYYILTPASYSGAVLDANGNPVAKTAPAGTEYASITLKGTDARLKINGNTYTLIRSMDDLDNLDGYDSVASPAEYVEQMDEWGNDYSYWTTPEDHAATVTGYYALAQDLDAFGKTYTSSPIAKLSGTLTGLGHTIKNLTIEAPAPKSTTKYIANYVSDPEYGDFVWYSDEGVKQYVGLIGQADTGSILRDIGVVNAGIKAEWADKLTTDISMGALAGKVTSGRVSHAYSTGSVESVLPSYVKVGGLIGYTTQEDRDSPLTVVSDSYSDAQTSTGGGLIGRAEKTTVLRSHATGAVLGTDSTTIGGLIAVAQGTSVTDSYATGDVGDYDSTASAGGLIGNVLTVKNYVSNIINSFATGEVQGVTNLGGLTAYVSGTKSTTVTIDNCYATGPVTAEASAFYSYASGIGGLVSAASYTTISHSHAHGAVTAKGYMLDFAGGLAGEVTNSVIKYSYATGDVTGVPQMYGNNLKAHPTMTGGLVGHAVDTVIIDSYSTGNVSGGGFVGGLTGGSDGGSVSNSYASGKLTGIGNEFILGGVTAYVIAPEDGGPRTTYDNVYWNDDNSAFGNRQDPGNFSEPLPYDRWGDIDFYLNHTIPLKLADREAAARAAAEAAAKAAAEAAAKAAAEAAARAAAEAAAEAAAQQQAALEASAGSQAGHTTGQALQYEAGPSRQADIFTEQHDSVRSGIVFTDSDSYSANVKAISADGVELELEDDDTNK